jgi:low affinity Fe/Cu permease
VTVQTATAVITFLMIFCVQQTPSKDDRAMQARLDELIRVMHPARTSPSELSAPTERRSMRRASRSNDLCEVSFG